MFFRNRHFLSNAESSITFSVRTRFYLPILVILALLGGGSSARAGEAHVFESLKATFRVVVVASGLDHPWAVGFLPSGEILVTERSGDLRLITKGELQEAVVEGLPEISAKNDQGGLLDIALDPAFDQNGRLCLSYVAQAEGG
ncbi:MAG TPA: hypothetical protein DIC24_04345, partial [Gammaproteobacteria bacterium]|nr:hypothetical protein [Gammaproteobacteria bacterium]